MSIKRGRDLFARSRGRTTDNQTEEPTPPPMSVTDEALRRRAAAGDPDAVDALGRRYPPGTTPPDEVAAYLPGAPRGTRARRT